MSERVKYEGITFRENYDSTFEVFKAEFENTHVFMKFPEKERLVKLKEAFKLATGSNFNKFQRDRES